VDSAGNISNRAWEATLQGRFQDALHIYNVELVEELAQYDQLGPPGHLGNQAILFTLMGHLDAALEMSRQIRSRQHTTAYPVPLIGAILWMQGKRTEACDDWAFEIERRRSGVITHCDEAGGVEVPALLWWASAHTGFEGQRKLAEQELKRRGRTKRCQTSRWPGPLVPYLLGQSSENKPYDELLLNNAAAFSERYPNINFRYECLAHFHVGTAHLARGDTQEYLAQLKQVVAAKSTDVPAGAPPMLDSVDALRLCNPEYHLARAELRSAREQQ